MRRTDPDQAALVVALYLAGMTTYAIATRYGIPRSTSRNILTRAGVYEEHSTDAPPTMGVEKWYGDVRVMWSHDEWKRLAEVKGYA